MKKPHKLTDLKRTKVEFHLAVKEVADSIRENTPDLTLDMVSNLEIYHIAQTAVFLHAKDII